MASRKQAVKKTGAAQKSTRSGGKSSARKGTAPKVARAKKPSAKRSAAGRKAANARWGKKQDTTTGPE